jgi:hypothetical protein
VEAKEEFERFSRTHGVTVKHYHADNGRFSDNAWRNHVLSSNQRLTFCGVGAHHQNGRAEKRIRDLQDLARTSLIYANRRWPDAVDARLWPYALRHANDTINKTMFPGRDETPLELFSRTQVLPNMKDEHPFGCPVYALDGRLQGHIKIDKWTSRARLAIYLGNSPQHSQSVGLLLSLTSGLVSPQFHARYNDCFHTVTPHSSPIESRWQAVTGFLPLERGKRKNTTDITEIPTSEITEINPTSPNVTTIPNEGATQVEDSGMNAPDNDTRQASDDVGSGDNSGVETQSISNQGSPHNDDTSNIVTRSGRTIKTPARFDDFVAYEATVCDGVRSEKLADEYNPAASAAEVWSFSATSSDPDTMYYHEAMKAPDRAEFVKAMEKEIQAHTSNKNWKVIHRSEIPQNQMVLPAVWAMRRKQCIGTQTVYKWKARINIHGGKQIYGFNYWEKYAPVAAWSSIRLIMNMAALLGWDTVQLDFVLAYPQAPVETELYM